MSFGIFLFTTAPVLTHWRPDLPIIVETDASDYALAAILSIQETNGDVHPVAFHSRTFSAMELNKEIISALDTDETVQSYLADIHNKQYSRWSKDTFGFI